VSTVVTGIIPDEAEGFTSGIVQGPLNISSNSYLTVQSPIHAIAILAVWDVTSKRAIQTTTALLDQPGSMIS